MINPDQASKLLLDRGWTYACKSARLFLKNGHYLQILDDKFIRWHRTNPVPYPIAVSTAIDPTLREIHRRIAYTAGMDFSRDVHQTTENEYYHNHGYRYVIIAHSMSMFAILHDMFQDLPDVEVVLI